MLKINSIKNGIVIDHIQAGLGFKIFNYLKLDQAEYSVALIMNVSSKKIKQKDMIKIENVIDLDYQVLGLIDPNITINVIEDEKIKEKIHLELPKKVEGVLTCQNPRCITSVEKYITSEFYLTNEEKCEYRCSYCDEVVKTKDVF